MPAGVGILLAVTLLPAEPAGAVTGQYLEDRSARVYACPCEWSTDWAHRGREAVMAWQIERGSFRGVALDGLRAAAVVLGDFTLSEPTSGRRSVVVLDSRANAHQRDAGLAWLRSRYGELLGRIVRVRDEPIQFLISEEGASVLVGGMLDVRLRQSRLAEDTESWAQLIHDPFVPLMSPRLGTALHSEYRGPDLPIRWVRRESTITGYYGTFAR